MKRRRTDRAEAAAVAEERADEAAERGSPFRAWFGKTATKVSDTMGSAWAFTVPDPSNPVTGNSTYFDGPGSPYGGCGLPQDAIDIQDFVALNVYNTPDDFTFYPRPITGANASKIGMWNNGLNCGRYVQVTVGDYCTGVNDRLPMVQLSGLPAVRLSGGK